MKTIAETREAREREFRRQRRILISSKLREPTVEELLADPIASLLMARDGVQPRAVLAIVERARTALRQRALEAAGVSHTA